MNSDRIAIVIPVGPKCKLEYVLDTIESIRYYMPDCDQLLLIDDSGMAAGAKVSAAVPGVDVIVTPGRGKAAQLYLTLSEGYLYALQHYQFSALLRMDTDALIIGSSAEDRAVQVFAQDRTLGMVGSHKVDCNGDARDFSWARDRLRQETAWKGLLRHPRCLPGGLLLRRLLKMARANGYELGEFCMGGACFLSIECLRRLSQSRLLMREEIGWSSLAEDHIFGLLVASVGLRLGDLATSDLPMGLRWQGLPCSPQDLVHRGKKIIHSTRFWEDMDESQIRDFFRDRRQRRL